MKIAFSCADLAQMDGTAVSILCGALSFMVGAHWRLVWILRGERPRTRRGIGEGLACPNR